MQPSKLIALLPFLILTSAMPAKRDNELSMPDSAQQPMVVDSAGTSPISLSSSLTSTSFSSATSTSTSTIPTSSSASVSASGSWVSSMIYPSSTPSSSTIPTSSISPSPSSIPSSSIYSSPAPTSTTPTYLAASEDDHRTHDEKDKARKIRYKQCDNSGGTVTEIKIEPCEGGKGTINDPCQFHAGSNYTISLTYVTPITPSGDVRSNLIARDRTRDSNPDSEFYPYSGQSFDGCQYTTCPIQANQSQLYTYEFQTLNSRFDQLTLNMTDGIDGDSLMCAYFPITFLPSVTGRSYLPRIPFGGIGARR